MNTDNLYSNENMIYFTNVKLHSGVVKAKLYFNPHEIYYDSNGDVQCLSFNIDGNVYEYIYMEKINKFRSNFVESFITAISKTALGMAHKKLVKGTSGYHAFGSLLSGSSIIALKQPSIQKKIHEKIQTLTSDFNGYINTTHDEKTVFYFITGRLNIKNAFRDR